MDPTTLFIGVITGSIGMGYFIYGKKQQLFIPMITGAALCIYPYFVSNIWALCLIGLLLLILPFVIRS